MPVACRNPTDQATMKARSPNVGATRVVSRPIPNPKPSPSPCLFRRQMSRRLCTWGTLSTTRCKTRWPATRACVGAMCCGCQARITRALPRKPWLSGAWRCKERSALIFRAMNLWRKCKRGKMNMSASFLSNLSPWVARATLIARVSPWIRCAPPRYVRVFFGCSTMV